MMSNSMAWRVWYCNEGHEMMMNRGFSEWQYVVCAVEEIFYKQTVHYDVNFPAFFFRYITFTFYEMLFEMMNEQKLCSCWWKVLIEEHKMKCQESAFGFFETIYKVGDAFLSCVVTRNKM